MTLAHLENLVSRLELAARLGVKPQTIAHWTRQGWFPAPAIEYSNKAIYYDPTEVEAAMEERVARLARRGVFPARATRP